MCTPPVAERTELRRILDLLRSAHRLAAVGSWEAHLVGGLRLDWSDEARAIAGWTDRDGPAYEDFVTMVHPDDRPIFLELRHSALAGERPYAIDVRVVLPGDQLRRVRLEAEVVRDADGTPVRMVGAVQDRTGEIEALRRLRVTEVARRDLLQRLLDTADIERGRLARHLASGPIERLAEIEERLRAEMPTEPLQVWVDALASVRKAIEALDRTLTDIQAEPATGGLVQLMDELVAESAPGVHVHVDVAGDVVLRPSVQATLLRVVQEALHNVRKHAQASRAQVRWRLEDGWAHVVVTDDGRGFDVEAVQRLPGHLGIVAMGERVAGLGGRVDIRSRPGRTTVDARMPID